MKLKKIVYNIRDKLLNYKIPIFCNDEHTDDTFLTLTLSYDDSNDMVKVSFDTKVICVNDLTYRRIHSSILYVNLLRLFNLKGIDALNGLLILIETDEDFIKSLPTIYFD